MANELVLFEEKLEAEKTSILDRLPKLNDWLTPERWWSICYDLTKRGKLRLVAEKNPDSLIAALKDAAESGMEVDEEESFINVYNEKQMRDGKEVWLPTAQFQPMKQGLLRRAVELGVIAHATTDVIREGDQIEEVIDEKGRRLVIRRAFNVARNRKLVGAYAQFWLVNGLMDYELCDADDIESFKAASLRNAQRNNKDAKLSPAWQFQPGEMGRKSALGRGLKRMRGKRHAALDKLLQSKYDVEIEHTDTELPPDDLPNGEGNAADGEATTGGAPSAAGGVEDRTISEAEWDDLYAREVKPRGIKLDQVLRILGRVESGMKDPSELMVSQIPAFVAALDQSNG